MLPYPNSLKSACLCPQTSNSLSFYINTKSTSEFILALSKCVPVSRPLDVAESGLVVGGLAVDVQWELEPQELMTLTPVNDSLKVELRATVILQSRKSSRERDLDDDGALAIVQHGQQRGVLAQQFNSSSSFHASKWWISTSKVVSSILENDRVARLAS